ncbi:MAG: hypothetical protein HQM10_15210 [Candidatus Riflebacteria bacterium]|nr:hypothetical protein [Candidatus Riflebacteria bacterium]
MQNILSNIDTAFPVLFGGALAWIALWIVASIFYRRSKGKPFFPRKSDHDAFYESTGSGRSNRNFFTRLGGARNCLTVAVTDNSLIVQPKFPFNLMFLPEIYDLEYSIPKNRIHTIEERKFFFGKKRYFGLYPA